jgi:RNA polymerase sigma-32 factor
MANQMLILKQKNLPLPTNIGEENLDQYLNFVNQVPMLSEKEEYDLAMRLRHQQDLEAAQQLILSHLRFVVKIAKSFSGYGLALSDLIQEGSIGLMKAVKRFDPAIGVRLVSFAVHWIKAEIHEFVLKNWRLVKIATTKAQRKLFFNLRSNKKRFGWMGDEEINSVANELNVKPETVIEMEKRMNANEMAFDAPVESDNDENFTPSMYLEDHSGSPEEQVENAQNTAINQSTLQEAMSELDKRAQDIIKSRWLATDKATLHDLSAKYGISAERVRQLENDAMAKLKSKMSNQLGLVA